MDNLGHVTREEVINFNIKLRLVNTQYYIRFAPNERRRKIKIHISQTFVMPVTLTVRCAECSMFSVSRRKCAFYCIFTYLPLRFGTVQTTN